MLCSCTLHHALAQSRKTNTMEMIIRSTQLPLFDIQSCVIRTPTLYTCTFGRTNYLQKLRESENPRASRFEFRAKFECLLVLLAAEEAKIGHRFRFSAEKFFAEMQFFNVIDGSATPNDGFM